MIKDTKDQKDDDDVFGNSNNINPAEEGGNSRRSILKNKISSAARSSSTNRRLWSGVKDPRIVRVVSGSAFGGKDRHSKVSTIRGLRDRRVRLSVPTAIQLYDLQDRLGLNQPSKVVDWLLNAAQHQINNLPPLNFPVQNFIHFHQSLDQDQDVGIYNNCPHQDQNVLVLHNNSRSVEQDLGLIGNDDQAGFPNYASYQHWPDQSNKTYFSQLGGIVSSSQEEDVASASVFSSNYMTTVSSEFDGISTQQNLPLNSTTGTTIFTNSFYPGR